MSTKTTSPPVLPDDEKFDGSNYIEWSETILMACRLRGARGYIQGTIPQPPTPIFPSPGTSPASITIPPEDTAWTSMSPSWEEWDARDAWCHIAIRQNVKNAVGLGLKTDGTSAEAWKSLEDRYKTSTDLSRVYAQRELRDTMMKEGDDFLIHLSVLLTKYKRANAVGAKISDADFREIIMASLPSSWDHIIATLHTTKTSIDMIIVLEMHWTRVNRGRAVAPGTTAIALKAAGRSEIYNKKVCTNPVCKRKGHLIADCYWKGGGKEGQFPSGFGQRAGGAGSYSAPANNTASATSPSVPTAHAAVTNELRVIALSAQIEDMESGDGDERVFALSAMMSPPHKPDIRDDTTGDTEIPDLVSAESIEPLFEVHTNTRVASPDETPGKVNNDRALLGAITQMAITSRPDIAPRGRDTLYSEQPPDGQGVFTVTAIPNAESVAMMAGNGGQETVDTVTYADSGASNHCFANKIDFSTYEAFEKPHIGQAASREAKFQILGRGTVVKTYVHGQNRVQLVFHNALHTPDFAANLVSISQFDIAGLNVNFGGGRATVLDASSEIVLTIPRRNGMYVFEELATNSATHAMSARSHEKPTTVDGWHLRFCHFGIRTIKEMSSKNMVDGLQITTLSEEKGRCEDCIYGKQTNRPFDEIVIPETEVLERVHIDLWGPSRVQSVGGAQYALFITDGHSSYLCDYYLTHKSGDAVLAKIQEYVTMAELQTGKKVKCMRFDQGREFLNKTCENYCKERGIRIETTAPYAHQANGLPERTNRTIFEGVRAVRSDSGLPPSYWADITSATVYVKNFMPSRRNKLVIPAEAWFRKRQDVSHLRRIGSTAYAKVPKETNPSKLDNVSIKYTLLGYYGREAYKLLDRNTGIIIKSRNVVFEEGVGHRTSYEQEPLHDEPIFDDEIDEPMPHKHTFAPPAQTPVPEQHAHLDIPAQAPQDVRNPYPLAPRHRATDNVRGQRNRNVQLFNVREPPAQIIPAPPPRRSAREHRPTAAADAAAEFAQREADAKAQGEEWAASESDVSAAATYSMTIATAAHYADALDAAEFQREHMLGFQNDLDEYVALLAASDNEHFLPNSYHDAMRNIDLWQPPMDLEMDMMSKRGVFSKVKRPEGHKVIGLRWIYGYKYDAAGDIAKRKARLVAKGFNQIPGVDFDQTYASVARLESMRMCLAIIAHLDLRLWQIDFVAAYLNSENKYEVYTEQAPGFIAQGEEDLVYRAHKTVYGMMAGAHDWEAELSGTYDAFGYYKSMADPCVRHRVINGEYSLNVTYTDDVIGGSTSAAEEMKAIGELESAYDIKRIEDDEEKGRLILGMSMKRNKSTGAITLSQRPYLERILKRFGMSDCNPKYTPLPPGIEFSKDQCASTDQDYAFMKDKPYREALGSIMWAQVATRPDLSYAVNVLARYQTNPGPEHWKAILHVLAYIKATLDYKITYSKGSDQGIKPYGFVDADYGGDLLDTGRSTSGHIFIMAGGPVSWSSKRQDSVALSTTEAEYMATSRACQQSVWMHSFMREAGLAQEIPAVLYNDNMGSIALTQSARGHKKAKHIHIRYHYIRERVGSGEISVIHVPSEENLADILTKSLPRRATEDQCYMLGLFD